MTPSVSTFSLGNCRDEGDSVFQSMFVALQQCCLVRALSVSKGRWRDGSQSFWHPVSFLVVAIPDTKINVGLDINTTYDSIFTRLK